MMWGELPASESRGHRKGAVAARKEARVGGSGWLRHGRYQLTLGRGGMRVTTTLRAWQKLPLTWRGRWSGRPVLPARGEGSVDTPELLSQPPALTRVETETARGEMEPSCCVTLGQGQRS